MNRYAIDEEQLKRLKNIAVAVRAEGPNDATDREAMASYGYDIESVIAEVETTPLALDDETLYGEQKSDDEPEDDDTDDEGSEEDL